MHTSAPGCWGAISTPHVGVVLLEPLCPLGRSVVCWGCSACARLLDFLPCHCGYATVNHVHLCWEGLEHRPLQGSSAAVNKHSSHQTMVPTAPFSYPFLLPQQQLPPTTQWSQCWQWLQQPQGRSHTALG